jgi:hypothetical protein
MARPECETEDFETACKVCNKINAQDHRVAILLKDGVEVPNFPGDEWRDYCRKYNEPLPEWMPPEPSFGTD